MIVRYPQVTLTSVLVFNRRRAGEIERMFIEDFQNYERIENKDLLKTLSRRCQEIARKYVRFVIRGKLNRTVSVLLPEDLLACIEMVLKFRKQQKYPLEIATYLVSLDLRKKDINICGLATCCESLLKNLELIFQLT
ncbi:hypothetical protein NQ314_021372 [Rhamnusium bicolor]|uniref:Uncharacterized protein n=1 Tax=Rhamnusium bicolor TaxID=1586634 RepID=A0AAV8WIE4_9CUCU|nr:hypothetical protein NQ314_021372 [Rhamnusium bicolor]